MIHFTNYEEYLSAWQKWEKSGSRRRLEQERQYELVMEENTIYEIDLECEECLKGFWQKNAAARKEK